MKKKSIILLLCCCLITITVWAQCSICTRTAQQMGERPAKALNTGIIYLAAMPLILAGIVGYKWWKSNK